MLFAVILLVSFLVRLTRFDFPSSYTFAWGDGTRDFLVGSHILKYHEFPLTGPYNLFYDLGVHNSPIYFYLVSFFLFFYNNILTLSLVNIFLQTLVIVLIYQVTKELFNYKTAIIAALLFSFNPEVIKQADFIWQPYLMLPFALLALYLKVKSHSLFGLATLCFASLIHSSAYPWIPLFLWYHKKDKSYYIQAFGLIFFSLLLNGFVSARINLSVQTNLLNFYYSNLLAYTNGFLNIFYINYGLVILLLLGFLIAFKKATDKKSMIFLFTLLTIPIIFASFFNKIRLHYIILSLVMMPILVAKVTEIFKPLFRIIVVIVLLIMFSSNFAYFKDAKKPLENKQGFDNLTTQLIDELKKVKQTEGFLDYDFFQVISFVKTGDNSLEVISYPVLDTFLLVGLEEKLNKKLAAVSDKSPYNHIQINRKDYLLVSCFKSVPNDIECIDYFRGTFRDYIILKRVYNTDSLSIYLAKNGT